MKLLVWSVTVSLVPILILTRSEHVASFRSTTTTTLTKQQLSFHPRSGSRIVDLHSHRVKAVGLALHDPNIEDERRKDDKVHRPQRQHPRQRQRQSFQKHIRDHRVIGTTTTTTTTATMTRKRSVTILSRLCAWGWLLGSPTAMAQDTTATTPTTSTTPSTVSGSTSTSTPRPSVSAEDLAERLHVVPTFSIVDPNGVPYAVVGEDAKLSTYFFTTYDEADRILRAARKSAEPPPPRQSPRSEGDEPYVNPWADATISSVPLDVAVTIVTRYSSKGSYYFYVQAAEEDIQEALQLDGKGKTELAEGKVPLFYLEDFTLSDGKTPVYFHKSQLLADWKQQQPKKRQGQGQKQTVPPPVKVSELFSLVTEMVKPRLPDADDDSLGSIVFVPPRDSDKKAVKCNKRFGDELPFKLGERIVVL